MYIPYGKLCFVILFIFSLSGFFIKNLKDLAIDLIRKENRNFINHRLYYLFDFIKNNHFFLFFVLFVVFLIYVFFLSYFKGQFYTTTKTLTSFFYCPLYAAFGVFCSRQKLFSLKYIYFLASIYFLFCIKGIFDGTFTIESKYFQTIFPDTNKSMYQNINYFLGIFLIITFGLFFSEKMIMLKKISKLKNSRLLNSKTLGATLVFEKFSVFLVGATCLLFMIIIGGRGAFISALVICFINLLKFIKDIRNKKIYMFFIIFTIFLCVFFIVYISNSGFFMFERLKVIINIHEDPSLRLNLFYQAIILFIKSPLWGSGIGSFADFITRTTSLTNGSPLGWYPHNFILELLCECGLVGFILFFFPFLMYFKKQITDYKFNFYEKVLFFLFVYQFLIFMGIGGLQDIKYLIFFFFLFISHQKTRENEVKKTPFGLP